MKRLSLAEKSLWYLAAFAVIPLGGCAGLSEMFTPAPATPAIAATPTTPAVPASPGGNVPAADAAEVIGTAVSTLNPALGAAILAAGGIIGAVFGRKTAPAKTVNLPAGP